jgi:glutathione reductase (NADPH)
MDYDLVVIGAGSGGTRAARIAGQLGARVAVVEASRLGGTCVNLGCVPKKLYMVASRYPAHVADARGMGWDVSDPVLDWPRMRDGILAEVTRLNGIYGRLLEGAGVEIVRGFGTLVDPHTIAVGERRLRADRILLATGGKPWVPPFLGHELCLVSDDLFTLERLPEHLVVLGGGYIGVEFATIFQGCGARVTLVNRTADVLTAFDHDVREHLQQELTRQGITLHLGRTVEGVEARGAARCMTLDDGTRIEADAVLAATGRSPNTEGLGLDRVGVATDDWGHIQVDDDYATSVPHIFAIGDVTGGVTLTPVAIREGHWLARRWFSDDPLPQVEHDAVPTAVFARPNVGTVGLSERDALARGHRVRIYRGDFRGLANMVSGREERTLVKLVVDDPTDRVLGLHVVGHEAGEVVQGFAVALKVGATKADFDRTIGVHPTWAEELVTLRAPVRVVDPPEPG